MNAPTGFLIGGRLVMFWIKLTCKGICYRYKALKTPPGSRYVNGKKRCNNCNIYLEWNGFFCPCCSLKLRTSPRNNKWKEQVLNFSRI